MKAALDVGSMSCRMVVADSSTGLRVRRSIDTYMGGASLSPSGEIISEAISAEGLGRVRAALDTYRVLVDDHKAPVRAVATESARRATNFGDLELVVEQTMGVPLQLLTPDEEAALSFRGVADDPNLVGEAERILLVDIGGGSTEFILGERDNQGGMVATETCSLPISSLLLTGAYLESDPPRPEELSAALSVVELHVDDLRRAVPQLGEVLAHPNTTVIGTGAVGAIAAVEVGLAEDPLNGTGDGPMHGCKLEHAGMEEVFRTLATEDREARAHNPGLPASRVDSIVGACVVLVEIMRQLGLEVVTVSQRGLADGVLLQPT